MANKKEKMSRAATVKQLNQRLNKLARYVHQKPLATILRDIKKLVDDCESGNQTTVHIRSLVLYSKILRKSGKTETALKHAERALKLAQHHKLGYESIYAAQSCAFLHHQLFSFKNAESIAVSTLTDARANGFTDLEADALAMVAHIFEVKEEFHKALVYLFEAIKCAKEARHLEREITALSDLGRIHGIQGDFLKSLECLDQALILAKKNKVRGYIPTITFRIGDIYRSVDDYDKAEQFYSKSLSSAEELGIVTEVIESKGRLGRLALQRQDYEQALGIFNDIDKITKKMKYLRHGRFNAVAIAEAYIGMEWYGQAGELLKRVLKEVQSNPESNHVLIQQILQQLAIVFSHLGFPGEADKLTEYSRRFKDSGKPGIYITHQQRLVRQSLYGKLADFLSEIIDRDIKAFEIRGRKIRFEQEGAVVRFGSNETEISLTPIETLLLKRLKRSQGAPVSVLDLAREYEPNANDNSPKDWRETVKVHIAHIRSKLKDDKGGSIIKTVRHKGWMLSDS